MAEDHPAEMGLIAAPLPLAFLCGTRGLMVDAGATAAAFVLVRWVAERADDGGGAVDDPATPTTASAITANTMNPNPHCHA